MISVLIPSKTDEYMDVLLTSMEQRQAGSTERVIVADNGLSMTLRDRWSGGGIDFVPYDGAFVFAKAINLCASVVPADYDLLVLNDDTEILTDNWLAALEGVLRAENTQPYGLLGLQIRGGVGNPEQVYRALRLGEIFDCKKVVCFVAVVVRWQAWGQVGPLDEQFTGYGYDDDDYNVRVRKAGWKIGVVWSPVVQHGKAGLPHSGSYGKDPNWTQLYELNRRLFERKWTAPEAERGQQRRCLNIGCGDKPLATNTLDAWVNLDMQGLPGVDVVRNITRGLPFADATFDHVLMDNVLEHLRSEDAIFAINEIDRVLKVGGTAEIIVPHAGSQGAIQDPTHKSLWVPRSVLYWSQQMTPFGGKFVGITANLVPSQDPEVYGDMRTEAFIRFRVKKEPLKEPT